MFVVAGVMVLLLPLLMMVALLLLLLYCVLFPARERERVGVCMGLCELLLLNNPPPPSLSLAVGATTQCGARRRRTVADSGRKCAPFLIS